MKKLCYILVFVLPVTLISQPNSNRLENPTVRNNKVIALNSDTQKYLMRPQNQNNRYLNQNSVSNIYQAMDSAFYEHKQENGDLFPARVHSYEYREDGRIVQAKIFKWVFGSSSKELFFTHKYNFYPNGLLESDEFQFVSGSDEKHTRVYTYNLYENITSITGYSCFLPGDSLKPSFRRDYIYENKRLISLCEFLYNREKREWDSSYVVKYNYNDQNQLSETSRAIWFSAGDEWIEVQRNETVYVNNNPVTITASTIYNDDNVMLRDWKKEQSFNSGGNITSSTTFDWNDSLGLWLNEQRWLYHYDQSQNNVETIDESWNSATLQWYPYRRMTASFNLNYAAEQFITPPYYFEGPNINEQLSHYNNMPIDFLTEYHDGTTWHIWNKWTYYYSDKAISYETSSINKLMIYPNPASYDVVIQYILESDQNVSISFFNQLGKQVDRIEEHQSAGFQKVVWRTLSLPSGMYYFRLETGEEIKTGKLMLMR